MEAPKNCNNRPAPRLYRRPPSVIRTNERLLVDIAYLTTAVPLPANSGHLTVLEPAFEIGVSEPLGGTANE